MGKKIDWEDEFGFEEAKNDNKELHRFIGRILSNWYWFVVCAIIGLTISFLYLRYSIPIYKINAKLLVEDSKKGGGMLGASALGELSGLMGAKSSVDNEVEVLRTKDLMHAMVLKEGAYINYFVEGKIKDAPVTNIPYRVELLSDPDSISQGYRFLIEPEGNRLRLIGKDTSFVVVPGKSFVVKGVGDLVITPKQGVFVSDEEYGVSIVPVKKAVASLMGAFSVEVTNKLVSTIDLSLNYMNPKRGERLLASLIQEYISRNLHDKNVVADSTLAFINVRLTNVKDELAGVEDRISGYKKEAKLADISEQSKILLVNSAEYIKSLAAVETQLSMLDALSHYLQDNNANPRVVPSAVIPSDVSFNTLVAKYNDLVLQRERLLLANTEENPLVQNVTTQIAGLRSDMIVNLENAKRNLEINKNSQAKLSNAVQSQIQQVPTIERGYIDLARLQQIKQAQYMFLQEKWEETAIGRTANVSNAKIIDSPRVIDVPISPKPKMVYMIGLLVGLAIPLVVLYIIDVLNVRVRSIDDVRRLSTLPILSSISHATDEGQIVVDKTSRAVIVEQFRAMRTNLEFSLQGGNTILMTSSMSKEGKSFIAMNLAISLALLDKKVLLMELDLRKPTLTNRLGLVSKVGFSQYVVRPEMVIEDIIVPSESHELVDLVQAGAIPPNPAELLIHPRAVALMEALKSMYDYIIIDAPPVGLVTDAQLLSRYSDMCLYIVRQGFTYKDQLTIPNNLVSEKKMSSVQLVVNDVKAKGGYYSNYGYGYGYGGYGEEERPKGRFAAFVKKFKK